MSRFITIQLPPLPPRDDELELDEDFEYQDNLLFYCSAALVEAGFSVFIKTREDEMIPFEDWEDGNV